MALTTSRRDAKVKPELISRKPNTQQSEVWDTYDYHFRHSTPRFTSLSFGLYSKLHFNSAFNAVFQGSKPSTPVSPHRFPTQNQRDLSAITIASIKHVGIMNGSCSNEPTHPMFLDAWLNRPRAWFAPIAQALLAAESFLTHFTILRVCVVLHTSNPNLFTTNHSRHDSQRSKFTWPKRPPNPPSCCLPTATCASPPTKTAGTRKKKWNKR